MARMLLRSANDHMGGEAPITSMRAYTGQQGGATRCSGDSIVYHYCHSQPISIGLHKTHRVGGILHMTVKQAPIIIMEEVTDPAELQKARAQDERFERNWAWFEAHATEIYAAHRGKCICVAGAELFVADTPKQLWLWLLRPILTMMAVSPA